MINTINNKAPFASLIIIVLLALSGCTIKSHKDSVNNKNEYNQIVSTNPTFSQLHILDSKSYKKEIISLPAIKEILLISFPYVYYESEDNGLYQLDIIEKKSKLIVEEGFIRFHTIINNWIYYEQKYEENKHGLFRVNKDGTRKIKILDIVNSVNTSTQLESELNKYITDISVEQDSIYFLENNKALTYSLIRTDLDGSSNITISDNIEGNYQKYKVYNDWIYFRTTDSIYKINKNSNKSILVFNGLPSSTLDFIIHDNQLYFYDFLSIYKADLEKIKAEKIANLVTESCDNKYYFKNNFLYFITYSANKDEIENYLSLCRYNLKTEESEIIEQPSFYLPIYWENNSLYVLSKHNKINLIKIDLNTGKSHVVEYFEETFPFHIYVSNDIVFTY